jgi:hypothetical protein
MENWSDYTPIGSPGDSSYMTLEDYRSEFISIYLQPYIDQLEPDKENNPFLSWLFAPITLLMIGMVAALAIVTIIYRSLFAALATLVALIVAWFNLNGGL